MNVPLLDVNAQNHPLEPELTAAFSRILKSGVFIQGPEVEAFEGEIAAMVGTRHAIGVSSGTDAILLALMTLGIGPGDEVICPSYTFFATAGCVSRVGATPVFVDSCPVCFNMDPIAAEKKISKKTKAIIPVHLFGQSADMDQIMQLAAAHDLKVIEDGAQSIGAKYKGKGSGTIGDFGTYSFFPSKNLGGFGDGGMVVCNDDSLAEKARIFRTHGSKPKYYHRYVGGNFRLDPLQAALLRVKLSHYGTYTVNRQANAADYIAQLSALDGVVASVSHQNCPQKVVTDARIVLPVASEHNEHIWNQFTLSVLGEGKRDKLKAHLLSKNIGCEIYYPVTMDQQECFAYTPESARIGCEVAHSLATEALSIPIYPELQSEQRSAVVSAIRQWLLED
jgi:dTDP-4-amino-4,6-dideoxygalactose transaminase